KSAGNFPDACTLIIAVQWPVQAVMVACGTASQNAAPVLRVAVVPALSHPHVCVDVTPRWFELALAVPSQVGAGFPCKLVRKSLQAAVVIPGPSPGLTTPKEAPARAAFPTSMPMYMYRPISMTPSASSSNNGVRRATSIRLWPESDRKCARRRSMHSLACEDGEDRCVQCISVLLH